MEKPLDFKERASETMFIIRGFAIFLVVLGHVIGARDSGIRQLCNEDILELEQLYSFIYTFHMPIFFLSSGFAFTAFSTSNRKFVNLVKSRAQRLLIPLLCWAPIYYIFRSTIGKIDFRVFGIVESVIKPDFIFWFFPAIFFASVLGILCLKFFRSWFLYTIISVSLFVLSLSSPLADSISVWFYFNSFYFIGCVMGSYLFKKNFKENPLSGWQTILIVAFMMFAMFFTYFLLSHGQSSSLSVKFINGLLGFSSLYIAIDSKSKFFFPNFLNLIFKMSKNIFLYLGKISMSIYLLHVICGSIVRTILVKFAILEPSLHLTVGLFTSVIGSVLIHRLLCQNRLFLYSIGEVK